MMPRHSRYIQDELPLIEDDEIPELATLPEIKQVMRPRTSEGDLGLYRLFESPEVVAKRLVRLERRHRRSARAHQQRHTRNGGPHLPEAA